MVKQEENKIKKKKKNNKDGETDVKSISERGRMRMKKAWEREIKLDIKG